MTIQHKTARQLMYDWHGGQFSSLYAAASSGLVDSWETLEREASRIGEPDRTKLLQWIENRKNKAQQVLIVNQWYFILPWIGRS